VRFASFVTAGRPTWGVLRDEVVADFAAVLPQFPTLRSFLEAGSPEEAVSSAWDSAPKHSADDVTWLPVVPNPAKILCVGVNYEMHRIETGRSEVQHPTIFTRFANTLLGHEGSIVRPRASEHLDFEGELAIVIGKTGRYIDKAHAFDYVAGYACFNDGSVRDFQNHTHQFTPGKNFPSTGAFGPYLVTRDEMPELSELTIATRLNGVTVQESTFAHMIFDVPAILEYCSTFTRLEPGDVIATGTPGGVGAKRTPPLWMKPGDVVEVEIESLGTLRNTVVQEA
jgi:2-keto-4-pentenoate hydratase/2-oxohepta-3-ene-1,7-dioic acid hydratase in catechol pathway